MSTLGGKGMPQGGDYRRMLTALLLCSGLLLCWQYFVEYPHRQQLTRVAQEKLIKERTQAKQEENAAQQATLGTEEDASLTREQRLAKTPRVGISSDRLHGSIALKGLRFDDLTLANYRTSIEHDSPQVVLLTPRGEKDLYFAQIGWLNAPGSEAVKLPDENTLWQADGATLTPDRPLELSWNNGQGVIFRVSIALDHEYLFSIRQTVQNASGREISVQPYGLINRAYVDTKAHAYILHEGPIGVFENKLTEVPYEDLRKNGTQTFDSNQGWLGFSDKYWLSAFIPQEDAPFRSQFSFYNQKTQDRYQLDFLGATQKIASGDNVTTRVRFFAGAKRLNVLDRIASGDPTTGVAPAPLFDRAVDFGNLYFLTKPMFELLNLFYEFAGNFGIAILMLTVLIKLLMFPLANKSYKSTTQMRALQPQMERLRAQFPDDKVKFQQELMALYRREKINPAAGCLPMLIQMPVFFALYKVLFVTIEMRHAPFFGWLRDLSASDPSNVFTLFGYLDWTPPHILHLGLLPMIFCLTSVVQMRQMTQPTDPIQANMMKYMPFFLTFLFASMPAGLVLYWICSNSLSILQQWVITKRHGKMPSPVPAIKKA